MADTFILFLIVFSVIIIFFIFFFVLRAVIISIIHTIRNRHYMSKLPEKQEEDFPHYKTYGKHKTILYLRPFKSDHEYMNHVIYKGSRYNTFEALLASEMYKFGVPFAIGKPSEKQIPQGAKRFYVSPGESWQDVVSHFLKESDIVVLYVDFTPGVEWEISQSLEYHRDKLILIPRVYGLDSFRITPFSFLGINALFLLFTKSLFENSSYFSHSRRGKKYYRRWNDCFSQYMEGKMIDDSTCAVVFQNGHPVTISSSDGNLEQRLITIIETVQKKSKNIVFKNETNTVASNSGAAVGSVWNMRKHPLFSIYATLSKIKIPASPIGKRKSFFLNFLLICGRFVFCEDRFFYTIWFVPWIDGFRYSFLPGIPRKQGLKYTDIEKVSVQNTNQLEVITKYVSGSFFITFPNSTSDIIPDLERIIISGQSSGRIDKPDKRIMDIIAAGRKKERVWASVISLLILLLSYFLFMEINIMYGILISMIAIVTAEPAGKVIKGITLLNFFIQVALFIRFLPYL